MPAKKKQEEQINLLPQKGFQATTAGRILAWILSTFRIIVIITEIIVMIAFLSRFWFDAQNSDLNERIQHKQAVLSASADFESKYKDVQKRIAIFAAIDKYAGSNTKVLTVAKNSLPGDVLMTDLVLQKDKLKITCVTPNERSIQQLIVNLSTNPIFAEVSLDSVSTKIDNPALYVFSINALRSGS